MKLLTDIDNNQTTDISGSLMISSNSQRETYSSIRQSPIPEPTKTHMPVGHGHVIRLLAKEILSRGWEIRAASYASSFDKGNAHWVFAVNDLVTDGVSLEIAGHNSHIKMTSLKIYGQAKVNACTNLSVPAQVALRRKHTSNILNELELLMHEAVTEMLDQVTDHANRIETYKTMEINNKDAHDLIIRCMENSAIPASYIPQVVKEWRIPEHKVFEDRNLNSLYNAFTSAFKRSPAAIPERSMALHSILDHKAGIRTTLDYARIGE